MVATIRFNPKEDTGQPTMAAQNPTYQNIVTSYYKAILRYTPPQSITDVYANQLETGALSIAQFTSQLLSSAQSISIPGLVAYDLFFGVTPGSSGVDYLASYAGALQTGNYTFQNGQIKIGTSPGQYNLPQFSLQNVWVNLGATFASNPNGIFLNSYGQMSREGFLNQIYAQIFGKAPTEDTTSYLLGKFDYYVNYAGSEIGGYGAVAGLLQYVAEQSHSGPYPGSADAFLTAAAVSAAEGKDTALYGQELVAHYNPSSSNSATLTADADNIVASFVTGDLTPYLYNGVGPTLDSGDHISGASGVTNNTFLITDGYGSGNDVIPAGVVISNMQTIDLSTQGNAGGGLIGSAGDALGGIVGGTGAASGVFDVSTGGDTTGSQISGVKAVNILSAGNGIDNVRVDPGSVNAVDVTVNHRHTNGTGGVRVIGGRNVAVTDGDGLLNPGSISYNGPAHYVTPTSNGGSVTIGTLNGVGVNGASLNPTGTVAVTEYGNNSIWIYGGKDDVVTTYGGGSITVGSPRSAASSITYPTNEPTGSVTITDDANVQAGSIAVYGAAAVTNNGTTTTNGVAVTVNETALMANDITVGTVSQVGGVWESDSPTGGITVNVAVDTPVTYNFSTKQQTGLYVTPLGPTPTELLHGIRVTGGADVDVTTNANSVTIGTRQLTADGSLVANGNPTGTVTVNDTATLNPFDYRQDSRGAFVEVFGGQNVTVHNAGGAVTLGGFASDNRTLAAPSGPQTVINQSPAAFDNVFNTSPHSVTTYGGTDINILTNAGGVSVGDADGRAGAQPTGTVTVVDTASSGKSHTDGIQIYGGTDVKATSANGYIQVGNGTKATTPTGSVTTVVDGIETGGFFGSDTDIRGGTTVSATTTGGDVHVGTEKTPVSGPVTITDTFGGSWSDDNFSVNGGKASSATTPAVLLTTNATAGSIRIGNVAPKYNSTGTGLSNLDDYANGNVTVFNETAANTGYAGTTPVYGTGGVIIKTNGATEVSVTGDDHTEITDIQTTPATGGAGAGQAIGQSTLATVSLDHAGGGTITSDVLSDLTIRNFSSTTTYTVKETPLHKLSLTLGNNASAGNTTAIVDGSASSLVINQGTSAATEGTVQIDAKLATSLAITTGSELNLNLAADTKLTSISLNNTNGAAVDLGTLPGIAGSVTVASTSDGSVTAELDASKTSFVSNGSGSDTVSLTNNNVAKTVQAGTNATNAIIADYIGNANGDTPLIQQTVRGFSVLGVGDHGAGSFDATGFSSLQAGALNQSAGANSNTAAFVNVGSVVSLAVNPYNRDDGATPVIILQQGTKVSADSTKSTLNLVLGKDGTADTGATVGDTANAARLFIANTSNISIDSRGTGGTSVNNIRVSDVDVSAPVAVTVKGDEKLKFTLTTDGGSLAKQGVSRINASAATGAVDASGAPAAKGGITVIGGAGKITASGASEAYWGTPSGGGTGQVTDARDTFTSGAGGGEFALGAGGGYNPYATVTANNTTYFGVFDTGYEQINLGASTAVSDKIGVTRNAIATFNGSNGGVNSFQAIASTAADMLSFSTSDYKVVENLKAGTTLVLGNGEPASQMADALDPSGNLANALANVSFSSSNGILTIVANGTGLPPTADTVVKAAEIIVSLIASGKTSAFQFPGGAPTLTPTDTVAAVTYNADTWVVSAAKDNAFATKPFDKSTSAPGNTPDPGFSVVELNGVSGIVGFGNTANVGAKGALITTATNASAGHAGGSAYDDTGFSLDTLTAGQAATATTTYNNLGPAAELDIHAGGNSVGNVAVTQTGTSGENSLYVNFQTSDYVTSLNTTGDWLVNVGNNGTGGTIDTLADKSTTASLTNLRVTGSGTGNVLIGAVSASALQTIDASKFAGSLTLGQKGFQSNFANAPVNYDNLTIKGALGGDTIFANGAKNVISIGSATTAVTGNVNITAAGKEDKISLINANNNIHARLTVSGDGDTISVDGGENIIAGGFDPASALPNFVALSTGLSDTINLADSGRDFVWVGNDGVVNLTGDAISGTDAFGDTDESSATIMVKGDLTGTTSDGFEPGAADDGAFVTINGADVLGGHATISLTFLNQTEEFLAGDDLSNTLDTARAAFVNIQGAASLGEALNQAINQSLTISEQLDSGGTEVVAGSLDLTDHTGLIAWFQYGGDTYITEAINATDSSAAHVGLQAGDAVVKLSGLVDLSDWRFQNHSLTNERVSPSV